MADTVDIDGNQEGSRELPDQFLEAVRPDLVKKAVHAMQANGRQAYGSDKEAGLKHVTYWKQRNRAYRGIRGKGYPSSRTPRKITFRRGMQMSGPGGEAPQTVGGRKAHPPKPGKDFDKDINKKERRKAIRSAISATADKNQVLERGHRAEDLELPLVVEDELEEVEKTGEIKEILENLGLEEELERCEEKKVRAGRGTIRGRKYKRKVGPLIVVGEDNGIKQAAKNIPGVDVVETDQLNAELLAPGTQPGRLTVWTTNALDKLGNQEIYM